MLLHIYGYARAGLEGNTALGFSAFLLAGVLLYYLVCTVLLWRIDVAQHRLPDKIVLPMYAGIGLPLFCVVLLTGDAGGPRRLAYSCAVLMGIYWILRKVSRNALGFGDVKLAGALGLLLGYFSPMNLLWAPCLLFCWAAFLA